jgi:peptidoglycan/LPS O-acetylase OafA/YrhL
MQDTNGLTEFFAKVIFRRYMRLIPLYLFTLLFFWKFITVFGGDGPMFFMYDETNGCNEYWYWHLLFLNNLIPFNKPDHCMHWTWYSANEFQFFILLIPFVVPLYFRRRKMFFVAMTFIFLSSFVI